MNGVWCVIGSLPYEDGWLDSVWSTRVAATLRHDELWESPKRYGREYEVKWFPLDSVPEGAWT